MIRVAAVGDLHVGADSRGQLAPQLTGLDRAADVFLIAGDLTRVGTPDEVAVLIEELADVTVPIVAVLGNHDHHAGRVDEVVSCCRDGGIVVLDGSSVVIETPGGSLGIAGSKGFAGGFTGTAMSAFGERAMKDFVAVGEGEAERLAAAIADLQSAHAPDRVVVLLHYSPVRHTLDGEPREIYPFLGCGMLAEVVDDAAVDLVVHGHAHHGVEFGITPGGIPVRNVAQPVIGACYRLYQLGGNGELVARTPSETARVGASSRS